MRLPPIVPMALGAEMTLRRLLSTFQRENGREATSRPMAILQRRPGSAVTVRRVPTFLTELGRGVVLWLMSIFPRATGREASSRRARMVLMARGREVMLLAAWAVLEVAGKEMKEPPDDSRL